MKIFSWIARIIVAFILLQTLFFKFTGAPESVYIFETVGMEPWGRYASGIAELIAGILLLVPRTKVIGAAMAIGVISGAIFFHFTKLGIEVKGDGGLLFFMAIAVFVLSLALLFLHRKEGLAWIDRLRGVGA
ncbi:MAG: DoxX family protein [Bacteroidota bacterium]